MRNLRTPVRGRVMDRVTTALVMAAAAGAVLLGFVAESWAASIMDLNFWLSGPRYEAVVPLCDEPAPLAKIQSRFYVKEHRFWNTELKIVGFQDLREVAFMPWASGTIPRRFCTGKAVISDGKSRTIHYLIAEDTGILGTTWGVEWCVVGLDRNWAYNPACRMALP
ncbi:MAG: hypothetical protein ACXW3N_03040 [Rhodoplanes sp.]